MSELDEALLAAMHDFVNTEHKPFCHQDFCPLFTLDGKTYHISRGTFRNKISKFNREGLTEVSYSSFLTFYVTKGVKFTRKEWERKKREKKKADYDNYDTPIQAMLASLPMSQNALHDIRMRFSAYGIWAILSSYSQLRMNGRSKDIAIDPVTFGDIEFRVTVHRSDVVTVMAACSMHPVAADVHGLVLLTEYLTRLEYEIQALAASAGDLIGVKAPVVPRHPTCT